MNPATEGSQGVSMTTRVKDFLKDTAKGVEQDIVERQTWVDWQAYFERRRYCQEFRNPQFPWPGSSEIVMPLIDKVMKKAAPRFFQTLLGERPMEALSMDRASQGKGHLVEMFMGHLLHSDLTRSKQNMAYHIDDFHQHGWAPLKSVWFYEKHPAPIHLRFDKLPGELKKLVPVQTEKQATILQIQAEQVGQQLAILTVKEFHQRRDSIEQLIKQAYGLDESKRDAKTASEIFDWFAKQGDIKTAGAASVMGSTVRVNQPGIVAVSPYDCIFPQNTTDIQQAERISHRMRMGKNMAIRTAMNNGWDMKLLKDVLGDQGQDNRGNSGGEHADETHRADERERYHLTSMAEEEDQVFYEVYTWMSEEEYGPQKKISYIVHEKAMDKPLKIKVWGRPSGRFPWHITKLESSSRRIMGSRGLADQLSDIDAEITLNHRAKLNRQQVTSSPSFAYRPGSGFNPDQVRWIPGGMYPMSRPQQDIAPLIVPPMDATEEREEAILRTWAEEYVGASDFGLANPLSAQTEARTAREISAITQNSAIAALIVGSDFGETIQEVGDEYFDMFHTFGPDELWIARTGAAPLQVTKAQLAGNFNFSLASSIISGGPEGRAQKALQRLMFIMQGDLANQIGVKYELDVGEAIRDWMETDDPRFTARVLRERTEDEIKQIMAEQQRVQQLQQKALTNEAMSVGELDEATTALQAKSPHGKSQRVDLSSTIRDLA